MSVRTDLLLNKKFVSKFVWARNWTHYLHCKIQEFVWKISCTYGS